MEMELEPRVKPLPYKIKAMSRESPSQKAQHVLDPDLRSHWSTATNTKEWILLELDEPCLLSHIRIYNKSVLEWEIAVGLRYKPEAFVKVRPRCEAPRRDMMYPVNYTPCRYVRISCLRGNPIAIFFIQLIGVSVTGLEPEFQPVVNYLLPHIISHKQDAHDMHLQLLQDMTNRLLPFLPQLEADLTSFSESAESSTLFLAMLAGPFYPILRIVNERETARASGSFPDSDALRNSQTSTLTVSSNFEAQPRRSRSPSPFVQLAASSIAFRADAVFMLLRKAYKDPQLGNVCRIASRALQKLTEPGTSVEASIPSSDSASSAVPDEAAKAEASGHVHLADYSSLFGEEFRIPDDNWDAYYLNVLDLSAVEEGILHVLYACASQPLLCCKLAESNSDFWSALPLVQALLPALRPPVTSPSDQFDDSFWQWKQPFVQHALSQIVATSSSSVYRPLLHTCAGYLSSFQPSHAKAACILIDLCSGPLAPWISTVIAKVRSHFLSINTLLLQFFLLTLVQVDLAIELLEDLLGTIQGSYHSFSRARAALKYLILALSGHMDDMLAKYKEVKHKLLFLVEMLEPFLDPAITAVKNTIAFGDVSAIFLEKQEHNCAVALNVIRTAVQRPAVLPSLEVEWRRGSVAPSVLLSILGPHMPLPPEIDLCKCSVSKGIEQESSTNSVPRYGVSCKSNSLDEFDGKTDVSDMAARMDALEDASLLFSPPELKSTMLRYPSNLFEGNCPDKINSESSHAEVTTEAKQPTQKTTNKQLQNGLILDSGFAVEYFNLQADYLQLVNHQDCELRASEFQRLASELHSQHEITPEGHDAAIDALLLAAECYVNPFFMMAFRSTPKLFNRMNISETKIAQNYDMAELKRVSEKHHNDLETIALLESKRDKTVLQILLQAAKLDSEYKKSASKREQCPYDTGENGQGIEISPLDVQSADAVTLVRQNQALLCQFLIQRLQKEQQSMHEILMQSLLFLLHSATELFCPPENVIDIILGSAGHLNGLLTSFYYQLKEGNLQLDPERVHGVQRRWVLLQRLVIASSGGGDGTDSMINSKSGFQYRSLISPSSWMQRIPKFSSSSFPLVRFLGWMAISRYAKQYLNEQLFLASDLSQLTSLLSIFADELALTDNIIEKKDDPSKLEHPGTKQDPEISNGFGLPEQAHGEISFRVIYPDLHRFFPNMRRQFGAFGEIILEAVGLQLKSLSSSAVPDALCWFSDLCLWPFHEIEKDQPGTGNASDHLKGYSAKNTKAIILYTLEAIVAEHMEAMIPEIPRVVQILVSLCRSSYCDVAFLDSILCLLKPLISYAIGKVSNDEKLLADESSCLNFESLYFDELLSNIRCRTESQDGPAEKQYRGALMIFILGALFPDLSFPRRREILLSSLLYADFATSEPTSSFYDYLCGFQNLMESCDLLLVQYLEMSGILIPGQKLHLEVKAVTDTSSSFPSCILDDVHSSPQTKVTEEFERVKNDTILSNAKAHCSSANEIEEFSKELQGLISKLNPSIELCWKLHPQLAKKLTVTSAKCYMYSRCLSSIDQLVDSNRNEDNGNAVPSNSGDQLSTHWRSALEGLVGVVLILQQNHCWQVSSVMVDYLLGLPHCFCLDHVVCTLCSAIKHFCCNAPRISWRLQTDKWLSALFRRGISNLQGDEDSLVDLFGTMLGHSEPEQRSVALHQLGRLVGEDIKIAKISYAVWEKSVASETVSESIVSLLVSRTWDKVAALASSDPSILLRTHAMALLLDYIPFAQRSHLQSFLGAADSILRGLGNLAYPMREGPLTRLSLALLAGACLYSPTEDITLIPQSVWRNLETIGMSKSGSVGDMEKKACQALCRFHIEGDDAKEVLKEALSSDSTTEHSDPNFGSTRESILQVLATMTSVQSYFNFFSKKMDQEAMELEEAEIEMDLLQKEQALQEVSGNSKEEAHWTPDSPLLSTANLKDDNRLQEIKDSIRSLEKSRLKEEIATRRQKKLLVRRTRQKYLEEAALREMELLKELDRERTSEMEREIERQRVLELERAKTRELRHNVDMEREKQTQRDLQRELEQVESGVRPSRREFSSSTSSGRPRERYRERENGRSGHEGSLRPSSRGRDGGTTATSTAGSSGATNLSSSIPPMVLTGSRSFSSQPPTILQSRERSEDRSGGYDDNFDGSRDSGDTGSVGDPDLASAFDGPAGGFGSVQRQGSRGSKSRQIMERRERDSRREGKWERKHS
ncbi:uncharacterized protein LOC131233204 isoform X3 [Magnolia sinica]|uniref:uncharacterized protein LOC131233204 isoform X3 n=1 Tax=Magnolia sinica TaxID=86752 RepID=UPI002658D013|nr:uncharacterized protein LOC131233204 isoform X3 [Magnolia sinica]